MVKAIATELQYFAFTSDGWSSRANHNYISLTVHYIDSQWVIGCHLLETAECTSDHTANNLAICLEEMITYNLIQDVSTKWNSSYYIVEHILKQQQPLCAAFLEIHKTELKPRWCRNHCDGNVSGCYAPIHVCINHWISRRGGVGYTVSSEANCIQADQQAPCWYSLRQLPEKDNEGSNPQWLGNSLYWSICSRSSWQSLFSRFMLQDAVFLNRG